ncbi:MAG: hypothetical protein ACR2F2_04155, partial [Pyrinomonadaceae bacterium]
VLRPVQSPRFSVFSASEARRKLQTEVWTLNFSKCRETFSYLLITVGQSASGRLLIVCHTFERNKIRIINARKPTKTERKHYENG